MGAEKTQLDPVIGCIILNEPFWFPRELWVPAPSNFPTTSPSGKGYAVTQPEAHAVWESVVAQLADPRAVMGPSIGAHAETELLVQAGSEARYGAQYLTSSRLGQGAFSLGVLDAYGNRCAVTGERVRPVLEAAHIKPFALDGSNLISNGLSLRADIHKLFDRGYVTVDKGHRFHVSSRLKTEFDNGIDYYRYQGSVLTVVPKLLTNRPSGEYLEWHNDAVFRP